MARSGRMRGSAIACSPSALSSRSSKFRWHSPFGARRLPWLEQPAEPPVSGAVLRIDEDVGRAVDEGEPRPRDDAKRAERLAVLARVDMGAHHAGERIAVGDADPGKPERGGARDQLLRMRRAAQEREIRRRRQLGVAAARGGSLPSPPSGRLTPAQPVAPERRRRAAPPLPLAARARNAAPVRHHGRPQRATIVLA